MSERPTLAQRLLRALEGTDAPAGDVVEELEWRRADGRAPRFPRLWLHARLWMAVAGALVMAGLRTTRASRFVARDAFRALRSTPGATAFALCILTAGIGAATVTFSVVDAVVIRGLPFAHDDRIVIAGSGAGRAGPASVAEFVAWRDRVPAFDGLAALAGGTVIDVPGGAAAAPVFARQVSATLFDVLGSRPLAGRVFTAENEVAGRDAVIVIGYDLWQRAFGGDPGVIGRTVPAVAGSDRRMLTIVGIMPPGAYAAPFRGEAWVPFVVPAEELDPGHGVSWRLQLVGRLADRATPGEALRQMHAATDGLYASLGFVDPAAHQPAVVGLKEYLVGDVSGWMLLVLAAVVLVMLVACVNVANLMLARAHARAHELSVRAALGASPRVLAASLVVESLMLSFAAVGLGVFVANWGLDAVTAALPAGIARADQIAIDLRVLAAAGGAAVVTGLFFGLVPAWQSSRVALASSLKDTARSATSARRGWRVALMTSQVGLVGLLLVIATLFVSSFVRVSSADLGFDRHDLVSFGSSDLGDRVPEVLAALRATPGVASAAWLSGGEVPLVRAAFQGGSGGTRLRRADGPGDGAGVADTAVNLWSVSPGLFETAGVAILRGRAFRPDDDAGRVVILDETAAARIFDDGTDPLGRQVSAGRGAGGARTVVGVARAIRTDGPERPADAQAYYPAVAGSGMPRFLVRTAGPSGEVVPRLQSAMARLLPAGTALPDVRTMDEAFRRLTAGRRFNAGLMSVFGLVALLIGAAGVYAVMSSLVVERRRELGVRLALGATPGRVLGGVLRDAAWYLGLGLAIGLVAGRVVSEVFASLLFGVRPGDLSVYVVVASILATVGLLAALGPARRAARVDPLVTLRAE